MGTRIWTIGHSTRSGEEFGELLRVYEIELLADVRRFAGSRRYPQFRSETLRETLGAAGIGYLPLPELGGRRKPLPDSRNVVWRNESFRGYADYMETAEFRAGIERLLEAASEKRTAVMCAEAVWWRCHRALIADYLKAGGVEVIHILSPTKTEAHPWTKPARLMDGKLTYRDQEQLPIGPEQTGRD